MSDFHKLTHQSRVQTLTGPTGKEANDLGGLGVGPALHETLFVILSMADF